MGYKLFLVESPKKCKDIKKYLGPGWKVEATIGHFCDIRKETSGKFKYGIDMTGWEGDYAVDKGKFDIFKKLKGMVQEADEVYLASDPDREGEAIAWTAKEFLGIPASKCHRITFGEITKNSVLKSFDKKRDIDMDLVNAQKARRFLDRIIGFELSPFLQSAIQRGLSAGRVQSVVVKMIIDREQEIKDFKKEEYWTFKSLFEESGIKFNASLKKVNGKDIKVTSKESASDIKGHLSESIYTVSSMVKKPKNIKAKEPFVTTTLMQAAASKFSYSGSQVMAIAQELYERGFITYLRTDSPGVSPEAQDSAMKYIEGFYGREYLPKTPNKYKAKGKAQEAHECIRPALLTEDGSPENIYGDMEAKIDRKALQPCLKVYKLIWDRFIASQMTYAVMDTTAINLDVKDESWNAQMVANGSMEKFPGWRKAYSVVVEGEEESDVGADSDDPEILPSVNSGDVLDVKGVVPKQCFTKPPAIYTEVTLIKALEKEGIGRPATIAGIIKTVQTRKYVQLRSKKFQSTELGRECNAVLQHDFSEIINKKFTQSMEMALDDIAAGKEDFHSYLSGFWKDFDLIVGGARERYGVKKEKFEGQCPICSAPLIKITKNSISTTREWVACENVGNKTCTFTRNVDVEINPDKKCPKCSADLYKIKAKTGKSYWVCSMKGKCNYIESTEPKEYHPTEKCEKCGSKLVKVKSKDGRIFWACETGRDCGYILREKKYHPTEKCEKCGSKLIQMYSVKTKNHFWACETGRDCGYILREKKYHPTEKCEKCGSKLVQRYSKKTGNHFWSCDDFPSCKFILKEQKGRKRRRQSG